MSRRQRRAPRRGRGCARRADRPACAAGGRSPAPCRRAARIAATMSPRRFSPAAMRACASARKPPQSLGGAEDHRAAAEDAGGDRPLQRAGVGVVGHPRGLVGRHQPVLGDGDEQEVEEEALRLGRLAAGDQQVEVVGEAEPAHQVAAEVAAAHRDARRVGRADRRGRAAGLADLHAIPPPAAAGL